MKMRWLTSAILGAVLQLTLTSSGFAQPGLPKNYPPAGKTYGSGTSIALAAGGAAVVAVGVFMMRRHHSKPSQEATLVGCTEMDHGALVLTDEDTKTTYWLSALSKGVRPGERLILSGNATRSNSGLNVFRVRKLVRDDGPCALRATISGAGSFP